MKMVIVDERPDCAFCEGWEEPFVARYDGKTVYGPWANMCDHHYKENGVNQNDPNTQMAFLLVDEYDGAKLFELMTGLPMVICDVCHEWATVTDSGQSPGFAGPIDWWTTSCGHTNVDTSRDNEEAAR